MSAAVVLNWACWLALGCLLLAMLLTVVRLIRGPTLADRVLALDLITTLAMGFIVVLAILTGFYLYLDIAIALGLLGFLATIALARYLLKRAQGATGPEEGSP